MQKWPHRYRKGRQNILIRFIKFTQESLISLSKSNISPTRLLGEVVIHCKTSQLDKNLENEPNKPLLPLETSLLESLIMDLKLFNMSNSHGKINKSLPWLATSLPETLTIKSKWFDENNSLDRKQNLNPISNDFLKIRHIRMDFSE